MPAISRPSQKVSAKYGVVADELAWIMIENHHTTLFAAAASVEACLLELLDRPLMQGSRYTAGNGTG